MTLPRHCALYGDKFGTRFVHLITSSNNYQFSNVFNCQNQAKIFNNTISLKISPHLKCVATLRCEMSMP